MWSGIIQATAGLVSNFPVLRVSLTRGPLARPCLVIFEQVSRQAYIVQARAHSLLQASAMHIKHIRHIQPLIKGPRHEGDRREHPARVLHCAYVFASIPLP